jgi:pimeloyl-ACP methyl ester carboxylesterase
MNTNPSTDTAKFTAKALLYVPGLDGTGRLLHRQLGLFDRYEVVCQQYPQHEPQTYDSLAAACVATLEARQTSDYPRAVVLAESFGGAVALTLALRRPDLIERLVLINTFAYFPRRWLIQIGARFGPLLPPRPSSPLTRPFRGFFFFPPGTSAAEQTAWWNITADVPMRAFGYRMRIIAGLDLRPQLHKIVVPAMVIVAPNDRVVPPQSGRELARLLPNAKLLQMRVGHAAMIHPEIDIARFLADGSYW